MAKFNRPVVARGASNRSAIATSMTATGTTYEGAPGYARADAKSELFLLAVTNMVKENTFYEKAGDRDARYEALVREVAVTDPAWAAQFLRWLRSDANMRSASIVGALEFVKGRLGAKAPQVLANTVPGFSGDRSVEREVLSAVLQRADEPGEALAYWISRYGKALPAAVKRGLADAAVRLYDEYSLLKYDTARHGVRFADVLDLTHPIKDAPWKGDLYKFALDRRHNRDDIEVPESLLMVRGNQDLREQLALDPKLRITPELLRNTGMTWEDILSLLGDKVDKKVLWEALIPTMGIFAQVRNLRNFDKAGVSDEAAAQVIARLQDPVVIAKSRMFPFRFLAAQRSVETLRWGHALDKALGLSVDNIPELPGRTLVLVDRSGSMFGPMSDRSELTRADAAAVFGGALALRNWGRTTLVEFGSDSREIPVPKNGSLLKLIEQFGNRGGTYTAAAARKHYSGHDRMIIVTDEQSHDGNPGGVVPDKIPVYTWNLAGYRFGSTPGGPNRHVMGGLTDQAFRVIPLLEAGTNGNWPWEQVSQD